MNFAPGDESHRSGLVLHAESRSETPQDRRNAVQLGAVALAAVAYGAALLTTDPPRPDLTPRLPPAAAGQASVLDLSARSRQEPRLRKGLGIAALSGGALLAAGGVMTLRSLRDDPRPGLMGPFAHDLNKAVALTSLGAGVVLGIVGGYMLATPPRGVP